MENLNQSTRLDYWRSFKSLLCAIPMADSDNNHKNVMDMRLKLISKKDDNLKTPRIFPKIIERDGTQETIGWIDTSYGAYAIIEKTLPIPRKGIYHSHEGVSVLFSEHPKSLEAVLSGDTTNFADIDVLSFHRKGDHFANGEMSYDKMAERIGDDHVRLKNMLPAKVATRAIRKKMAKRRGQFEASVTGEKKVKNPRPSESVDRNALAPKL